MQNPYPPPIFFLFITFTIHVSIPFFSDFEISSANLYSTDNFHLHNILPIVVR